MNKTTGPYPLFPEKTSIAFPLYMHDKPLSSQYVPYDTFQNSTYTNLLVNIRQTQAESDNVSVRIFIYFSKICCIAKLKIWMHMI